MCACVHVCCEYCDGGVPPRQLAILELCAELSRTPFGKLRVSSLPGCFSLAAFLHCATKRSCRRVTEPAFARGFLTQRRLPPLGIAKSVCVCVCARGYAASVETVCRVIPSDPPSTPA